MPTSRRRATPTRSTTAQRLGAAVDALIAEPSAEALQAARAAWLAARVPYQQTEAYPLRQRHRRRVGGQGERLAARRGADRLRRPELWRGDRREPLRRDQRHRQPELHALGRRRSTPSAITPELLAGHAAGGGRDRGQRRHRLPRDRVPALGAGPERHRAGRRQPALDRLRGGRRLHRRQLRPARRLPEGGDRPAALRPRVDGRPVAGRRRRARGGDGRSGRRGGRRS